MTPLAARVDGQLAGPATRPDRGDDLGPRGPTGAGLVLDPEEPAHEDHHHQHHRAQGHPSGPDDATSGGGGPGVRSACAPSAAPVAHRVPRRGPGSSGDPDRPAPSGRSGSDGRPPARRRATPQHDRRRRLVHDGPPLPTAGAPGGQGLVGGHRGQALVEQLHGHAGAAPAARRGRRPRRPPRWRRARGTRRGTGAVPPPPRPASSSRTRSTRAPTVPFGVTGADDGGPGQGHGAGRVGHGDPDPT